MRRITGLQRRVRDDEADRRLEALELRIAELENAQRDGNAALAAAPLRMLMIDSAYQVVAVFAADLETLLRSPGLRGEDFLAVLRRLLSETRYASARAYLQAVFDPKRGDAELASINPLDAVEIMLPRPDGSSIPRMLSFGFRRIPGDDERALVWIDDVTERLRNRQELRAAGEAKARQLEILLEIVHLPRPAIDEFLAFAHEELTAIDAALRASDVPLEAQIETFRRRLAEMLKRIGAIERRAREMRFGYFERAAGAYGRKVRAVSSRTTLGGDDFLALVLEQSSFRAEFDDLRTLRRALDVPPTRSAPNMVAEIDELAARLAAGAGKEIVLDADGFDTTLVPSQRRALIRAVLEELTRNAVLHGIESPEARAAAGKPRAGRLEIRSGNDDPQRFAFIFRDDGCGFADKQAAALAFASDEGRGLAGLRRRIVDECGGSLSLDSRPGVFCEFSFVIPDKF